MNADQLMERAEQVFAKTYKRFPVVLTRGRGATVWDVTGRAYTDFVAGIAVCNLGHAHPRIAAAVARQAETLCHVSNLYYTVPQIELAEWLTANSFADRVFLANSGAEANEAAIKIARRFQRAAGHPERYRIVAMEHSFHGRTMATLSATGQEKVRQGFDPVLDGFDFVPFDDAAALEAALTTETGAVLLEPIQGEGGVRCPAPGYLAQVREVCDRHGVLLIFDEVQTGMGRTGTLFAHQHSGVCPDVMTLAKALANGLPIGAMLASERVGRALGPGSHGSTFGGTPLVTAAALETVRLLTDGDVIGHGRRMGEHFKRRLEELAVRHPGVVEVRGTGLLLGLKLDREGASLVTRALDEGFLINCTQDTVLRFIPPLVITREQIDALVDWLDGALGGGKVGR